MTQSAYSIDPSTTLWYSAPARPWDVRRHEQNTVSDDALPIGNGRLGAMICGGTADEVIHLNEDSLWSGVPYDPTRPGAVEHYRRSVAMVRQGKISEASYIATEHLRGDPNTLQAYQPFADLVLNFSGHDSPGSYRRGLDLSQGIAWVSYEVNGVSYRREMLASCPDQVIAIHLTASKPGQINVPASFACLHRETRTVASGQNTLRLIGQVTPPPEPGDFLIGPWKGKGLRFEGRLRVASEGGQVRCDGSTLTISGADSATLYFAAATSFRNYTDISSDPAARVQAVVDKLATRSYADIRSRHIADHQALFNRMRLDLGVGAFSSKPTDQRLGSAGTADDPALLALYLNFGRYLLIASSRPQTQAANLQGIWNQDPLPTWGSKYTTNINLQMNYWPAETGNLSELTQPLFALIRDISQTGRRVAKEHYGCRGWVLHHNTDLWRPAAPVDWDAALWPTGSAWLCTHIWEHYLFTLDRAFLEEFYPIMRDAAQFYLDFLIEHPAHPQWLVTWPSHSPEHGGLALGPTMDMQILREHFAQVIAAAKELGVDEEFVAQLAQARARLVPHQIGRHGQLQEWIEDKDDPANQHRHVSHMWGVFPGSQITPRQTPELWRAAKQSLEFRGDAGTGWSRAWKIALWARLGDADRAHKLLSQLLRESTYPNLFDTHPPFQIDGNFGAAAGMIEMLVQSHTGEIELMPALPAVWGDGSVRGLRARGGFEIDLRWQTGRLQTAIIRPSRDGMCQLRYKQLTQQFPAEAGRVYTLGPDLQLAASESQ